MTEFKKIEFPIKEIQKARTDLKLTDADFALMLGYGENGTSRIRQMGSDLCTGKAPLRAPQARLLQAYLDGYRPKDWPNQ